MAAIVRKASFGRKPHLGKTSAKVRTPLYEAVACTELAAHLVRPPARVAQYYFTISDTVLELGRANPVGHSEQVMLVWRRGDKVVTSQPAAVTEVLDNSSGALSRTARVSPDLSLLCTLFSSRGKFEHKQSELELQEAAGNTVLCTVPLELTEHVTAGASSSGARGSTAEGSAPPSPAKPPGRSVVLRLPDELGTLRLTIAVRRLTEATAAMADDGASQTSFFLSSHAPDCGPRAAPVLGSPGPSCGGGGGDEEGGGSDRAPSMSEAVEQRWQHVQMLEQAREDAETIKGLQASLEALIQDKKKLKEEVLGYRQRAVLAAVASSRSDLIEQVATLQSRLEAAERSSKREAAAAAEQQANAFNSVIRTMADELQQVTQQRDDAWAKLTTLDKSFARAQRAAAATATAPASAHPSSQLRVKEGVKTSKGSAISRFRTAGAVAHATT